MKQKPKPKKENSERWLLTYSDLITLLMILFILLFAMSNIDKEKYAELSESMSSSMGQGASIFSGGANTGVLPEGGNTVVVDVGIETGEAGNNNEADEPSVSAEATPKPTDAVTKTQGNGELSGSLITEKDMTNFEEYVNNILQDLNMGASVGTSMLERGLTITFKNDVFFDSGSDILESDMKESLGKIAELLNKVDNTIIVEGHTDNVPISSNNQYDSNWQLSAARAANVTQYLVENQGVDGSRISAVGFGEYKPLADNETAQGRSQNRRVDIVILYEEAAE